jgi:hypothetical protein
VTRRHDVGRHRARIHNPNAALFGIVGQSD